MSKELLEEIIECPDYRPSPEAWNFHKSLCRFRFLIWGVKSGKTLSGAREFLRMVFGSRPNSLSWVVAPTFGHVQEAERELFRVLNEVRHLVKGHNQSRKEIYLPDGRMVKFRSADWPDNLRGPNIDGAIWFDEAGFAKEEAHYIVRERVAATGAEIIYTTTPHGRNWLWNEMQISNIPPDMPYGEYVGDTDDGGYFVSHYPTWQFPWVPKSEIEALRSRMSKQIFDQELGAMFTADSGRAIHNVEEAFALVPPRKPDGVEAPVLGLDLGKAQDWTAIVVMDGLGNVLDLDRWTDVAWTLQRERIERIAREWKACVVVDRANVGSVIEEDLRDTGLEVRGVEMNSPQVKRDLIQHLQLAFERSSIKIPDPKSDWAPDEAMQLYKELCWYEAGTTPGGHQSFSAPRGLTDDMVVALALAHWGRLRGLAGSVEASSVAIASTDWEQALADMSDEEKEEQRKVEVELAKIGKPGSVRPDAFKNIFGPGRKSSVGFESISGPFWR